MSGKCKMAKGGCLLKNLGIKAFTLQSVLNMAEGNFTDFMQTQIVAGQPNRVVLGNIYLMYNTVPFLLYNLSVKKLDLASSKD